MVGELKGEVAKFKDEAAQASKQVETERTSAQRLKALLEEKIRSENLLREEAETARNQVSPSFRSRLT